jgi:23S rRNA pseudouridine1911/1915/1917 synthase
MSYEEEETLQILWLCQLKKHQLMNNNIDSIDLEDELFEHFRFEVPKVKRFANDKYLMSLIQNATRNKIQTAATEGNIFVNNATVKSNYK